EGIRDWGGSGGETWALPIYARIRPVAWQRRGGLPAGHSGPDARASPAGGRGRVKIPGRQSLRHRRAGRRWWSVCTDAASGIAGRSEEARGWEGGEVGGEAGA